MFSEFYKRLQGDQPPFHQKVLRMNYDIPIGEVYKAVCRCFEAVGAEEELLFAPDLLECDLPVTDEGYSVPKANFYEAMLTRIIPMGQRIPGAATGVFDAGGAWYLRIVADDPDDVGEHEFLSGNFELFAPDELLEAAREAVAKTVEGHLITEGAKHYLEELTER